MSPRREIVTAVRARLMHQTKPAAGVIPSAFDAPFGLRKTDHAGTAGSRVARADRAQARL
jgi:hypothetical protein